MFENTQQFLDMLPIIIIGAGILISTTIEMYSEKSEAVLPWFSVFIFSAAAFYSLVYADKQSIILQNMLSTGGITNIFYFIFNIGAAIVCLLSLDYTKKYGMNYGEYYILIQASVLGMMFMAGAKDLFMIFLGLEIMSVSFYVLAGVNRKKEKAIEGALKYFLLGAFATGFLVYGIALIYGSAQSTSIEVITAGFTSLTGNILFVAGVLLFLIGFSFKIAAFPFHMWVPDVYQGSPTTVSGLFSTAGKAAAFSAIIATLAALFNSSPDNIFSPYLSVLALFSMLFGSIVAIAQSNIKRMLAYSSISHAGYMLIGLAAGSFDGTAGVIFYLTVYTFMNLAAFGIVALIEGENETNLELDSYSGLGNRNPVLAALLSICMFSLAGIPPMAGFFGKYYVFIAAIKSDLIWLAIVGIFSSVISVYFYLRVVVLMYFKDSEFEKVPAKSFSGFLGVTISILLIIALGIFPGSLLDLITSYL
ncbi:MAG: NADH-quinone oxidoreductase subunit N [Ignavibacteria bacterium]|nr:NADH-quinone oxidoreductase subunit N [Ignavibacteria bacterium]MBT8382106.1 NADH-quinone oxidoreductase subunit N [Ignavibacteria bacterium]MBT8392018.1 NADH-quinone oxidoreductase subunit N [Ignavibacteria bacterium]NNJ51815.1 NADH-quinone oxidoreductase subunit N [Ignavibacteriaceae bacterium]NNL21884.1 NADH-quinone oxidoreductase subunit N [Ignavibacteriaceae bacterium]